MKKTTIIFLTFLGLMLSFSSCAIQGERFRLQTRVNKWYNVLNEKHIRLFAEKNLSELGKQLDLEEQSNVDFAEQLRSLRINEAVMSFNGTQTAHFFYHTLLRDLAKFSYGEFMLSLNQDELIAFLNKDFDAISIDESIFKRAKTDYGFQGFTDQQILMYFRTVSFSANTFVLVYDWLAFFTRFQLLESVISGDIQNAGKVFDYLDDAGTSSRIALRKQSEKELDTWHNLKNRAYFHVLTDLQIIENIYKIILPEMEPDVRIKTINNIKIYHKAKEIN